MRRITGVVVGALAVWFCTGCALVPSSGGASGGERMSEAVRAATPDSAKTRDRREKRVVAGRHEPTVVENTVVVVEGEESGHPPHEREVVRAERSASERPWIGLVFGGGALGGADYDGFAQLGLSVAQVVTGPLRWDLIGTIGGPEFHGESRMGRALTDAFALQLEADARWDLSPHHTALGPYLLAGAGTGTLFWNYSQPIDAIQDGVPVSIRDDRINYFDLFAGAGCTLARGRHAQWGVMGTGGVRFHGWHTFQGFDNDVFPTTGFLRLLFELEFR